jgi:ferric-dicitrate binding protein FerR (iron transport regulator)
MDDIYEALLFYDELPDDRQQWVQERLDTDEDLADAFVQWRRVCAHLRERLEEDLPECRILVLFALEEAGRDDLLTDEERTALDAARPRLEHALDAHPALEDVVARIQDEQADFEAMWDEQAADWLGADATSAADEAASPATAPADGRTPSRTDSSRTDRAPRRPSARDASRRWTRRAFVGALVAAVAILVVLVWPSTPASTTYTVAEGETNVVDLPDGSQVRLVDDARLTHASADAFDRRVTLHRGRGFFDVQGRGGDTPFVVTTPTATTTVLGTQFGVEATAEQTHVILAEGRVEVGGVEAASGSSVVLEPGQQSRVDREGTPSAPETVDVTAALEWTGLFVFRTTPTATIAQQLSAHYGVAVSVSPALQQERVTGTFDRTRPVEDVLSAVAKTLSAEVRGNAADGFRLVAPDA